MASMTAPESMIAPSTIASWKRLQTDAQELYSAPLAAGLQLDELDGRRTGVEPRPTPSSLQTTPRLASLPIAADPS